MTNNFECHDRPGRPAGWLALGLGIVLAAGLRPVAAQLPLAPNDFFTNAIALTGPSGAINGYNFGATREPGEPFHAGFTYTPTVWYSWVAPTNGVATFDTFGTYQFGGYFFDSILAVYIGPTVNALLPIASNDDAYLYPYWTLDSQVTFVAQAGVEYRVAITEFGGSQGYFFLNWNMPTVITNLPPPVPTTNQVQFADFNFSVAENTPGYATIGVTYSGGSIGEVTVDYATTNGTAVAGVDYLARSGTLTFAPGQTNASFIIPILDNSQVNSNRTVDLALFNPTGGAMLGVVSNATLTITDDETVIPVSPAGQFQFSSAVYRATPRDGSAVVTVTRTNGAVGRVMVDYYTTNAPTFTNIVFTNLNYIRPAIAGVDYVPVSGTLVFDDYQMSSSFTVPLRGDPEGCDTAELFVGLTNPRPAPEEDAGLIRPILGTNSTASVDVVRVLCDCEFYFERMHLTVSESSGPAGRVTVSVVYPCGGPASVGLGKCGPLDAGSDHARNGVDYETLPDVVTFAAGQTRVNLTIQAIEDTLVEFNEDVALELNRLPNNPPVHPYARTSNIKILFQDQPPGALDRGWNPANVSFTTPPFNQTPGANNQVRVVEVQADGRAMIGGSFTHVNTIPRNRIARFNPDGSLDTTFNPGTGVGTSEQAFVQALAIYPPGTNSPNAGKILIAGGFNSYNGTLRNSIARLHPDGSLDTSFAPGNGADGPIRFLSLRADGKIFIGGQFFFYDDVWVNGVALINPDGSLDATFRPNLSMDGFIWAVAADEPTNLNSKVYIGGDFRFINGLFQRGVARLNADGSLDTTFNPGAGADGAVYTLAVQPDGRLLIGGAFSEVDLRSRNGLARLHVDGRLDTSFDPGTGADDDLYAMTLTPDGRVLIGGAFTSYNGTRRVGLARVKSDGTLDTSFMDTAYNQFGGLINPFHFPPNNFINSLALQPDGDIMIGGSFTNLGGNPYSPTYTRMQKQTRFNVARLIGTWGTTTTVVTTTNATNIVVSANAPQGPGNAQFRFADYSVDENGGNASITLQRIDGSLGTLGAIINTVDRLAFAGLDFTPQRRPAYWPEGFCPSSDGFTGFRYFAIPILDDGLIEGDETVDLAMTDPFGSIDLGGEFIPLGGALAIDEALLSIGDNDFTPGVFTFTVDNYVTNENARTAFITVIRTNGNTGSVTVDYLTRNGNAIAGQDYLTAQGTVAFASGQTNRTFIVSILDDPVVEFDETVMLILTNATGGAQLPGGSPFSDLRSTLTIVDDDFPAGRLNFSRNTFTAREDDPQATIVVTRTGGNVGALAVQYATADDTASSPAEYAPVAGTLFWPDGDSLARTFTVPLATDGVVDGEKRVRLSLFNASLSGALGGLTNAALAIQDVDAYGSLAFSQALYVADENGTNLLISVLRQGGIAGTISVDYATVPGTAVPATDYFHTNGTLTLGPGQLSAVFGVRLLDDDVADGTRTVFLALNNPTNALVGLNRNVVLQIVDNESLNAPAGSLDTSFNQDAQANQAIYAMALQPDGNLLVGGDFTDINGISRLRLARLKSSGLLDPTFNSAAGPDQPIRAMTLQPDGKILLGGLFSQVNGVNRSRIARLNHEGSLDLFFDPGAGVDNPVYSIVLQPADEKILIGGAFSKYNGVSRPGISRLNTNGTLDVSFDVGSGANGTVYAIALQNDGKILIGGEFTMVNGLPRPRLARLHRNGAVDVSFEPGAGMDAAVRTIAVQFDGRILVGGSFTNVNGTERKFLVRLEPDGTVDTGFLAGVSGPNNAVYALLQQPDGELLVAGDFTRFNDVTRNRLTRLNLDGTTDPTINFGDGANGFIATMVLQPDRKIVIGGGFTTYNELPRRHLARLHGGSLAGAGRLEFARPLYEVGESGTNVVIVVRRLGGTTGTVGANYLTVDGTALAGRDYLALGDTLSFPQGETRQSLVASVFNTPAMDGNRSFSVVLTNYSGGTTSGPQPITTVRVLDDESEVGFGATFFSVNENDIGGKATLSVVRRGATNTLVTVDVLTLTNGTATVGVDYYPTNSRVTFLPGETLKLVNVRIVNDALLEGNETVPLLLTNPLPAGAVGLGLAAATLNIVDDDFASGVITLVTDLVEVEETAGAATFTVVRTNGSSGIVSVRYQTVGGNGLPGRDYGPTNNILAFADGETVKSFSIRVFNTPQWEGTRTVNVILSEVAGGAGWGPITNATIRITDDEPAPALFGFLTNAVYVDEFRPVAALRLFRSFDTNTAVTVDYFTADDTALAGVDYAATNGTVAFGAGETEKVINVSLLNDRVVQTNHTFLLLLTNAQPGGATQIQGPGIARITIQDDDASVGFSDVNYQVDEFGFLATVTVLRTGISNRLLSVDFAALSGTAVTNADFIPTNGTLNFGFGIMTQSFTVRILDDFLDEGDETIDLGLSNLVGEATISRTNATVTIVDDDDNPGALIFQRTDLVVGEGATNAVITVLRTNGVSGQISVRYRTVPGTATPGLDYIPEADSLIFFNDGVTNQRILIAVVEDDEVEGHEFFQVVLSDPTGGALLPPPTTAMITIADNDFEPGTLDGGFDPGAGANDVVRTVAVQPDGQVLIGGAFTNVDGAPRNYVARLRANGTLDPSFLPPYYVTNVIGWVTNYLTNQITLQVTMVVTNDPGLVTNLVARGTDGLVASIGVADNGKIVLGGAFTQVNATNRNRIARLLPDGMVDSVFYQSNTLNAAANAVVPLAGGKTLAGGGFSRPVAGIVRFLNNAAADTSFDPAAGVGGVVNALAWDEMNRQVIIAGDFDQVNLISRSRVARLFDYGALDDRFVPPTIATGAVFAVLLQGNGKVLIGGDFTTVGGTYRSRVARLNTDGSLDTTFDPGTGADGPVYAMVLQPDGKILLGGDFTHVNGALRVRLARLHPDGSLDGSFDVAQGANGAVFAMDLQPDGGIIIGGSFTRVFGVPRNRVARLFGDVGNGGVVLEAAGMGGGAFSLTFPSQPGWRYALEVSTDLTHWSVVNTNLALGPVTTTADPGASGAAWRFYRVRQLSP